MSKTIELVESGETVDITGTSFCGYIKADYDSLVSLFGEPLGPSGDGNVSVEWDLEFLVHDEDFETEDYVTVTIYDWKESKTPYGNHEWHVGGNSRESLYTVQDYLLEKKHGMPNG